MEGFLSFWSLLIGYGTSANFPVDNLYTIIGMDAAVDLTTGIWVEALATVGVGVVEEGVVGVGRAIILTLHLLLASTVLLLSLILGLGAFLVMGGVLVLTCGWVGHSWGLFWLGLGLGPGFGTKPTL